MILVDPVSVTECNAESVTPRNTVTRRNTVLETIAGLEAIRERVLEVGSRGATNPRIRSANAERQRAYRERKRAALGQGRTGALANS